MLMRGTREGERVWTRFWDCGEERKKEEGRREGEEGDEDSDCELRQITLCKSADSAASVLTTRGQIEPGT